MTLWFLQSNSKSQIFLYICWLFISFICSVSFLYCFSIHYYKAILLQFSVKHQKYDNHMQSKCLIQLKFRFIVEKKHRKQGNILIKVKEIIKEVLNIWKKYWDVKDWKKF